MEHEDWQRNIGRMVRYLHYASAPVIQWGHKGGLVQNHQGSATDAVVINNVYEFEKLRGKKIPCSNHKLSSPTTDIGSSELADMVRLVIHCPQSESGRIYQYTRTLPPSSSESQVLDDIGSDARRFEERPFQLSPRLSLSRLLAPCSAHSSRVTQNSCLFFMMSASTAPPKKTMCFRRGGSSMRILKF